MGSCFVNYSAAHFPNRVLQNAAPEGGVEKLFRKKRKGRKKKKSFLSRLRKAVLSKVNQVS